MVWFGIVSAWMALGAGVLFVGFAGSSLSASFAVAAAFAIGVVLLIGAFRTLRKLPGGLRLLSGAWGLAAGFMVLPFAQSGSLEQFYQELGLWAYALTALALICIAGLVLTVTHKERK